MIERTEILKILDRYDLKDITIGVLGSHSALDVCDGAKDENFKTLVISEKGREEPYTKYFKTRIVNQLKKGTVDDVIVLNKFSELMDEKIQKRLRKGNTIFVPNRSFVVYTGIENIEDKFRVPIIGSRDLLRIEDREAKKNYYWVCKKASIPIPKELKPEEIDTLVMVKLPHATLRLERGFFTANSYDEYKEKSEKLIKLGIITAKDLKEARIEEYILGPIFNFNFFYSPLDKEIELLGVDWRFETNLDGIVRIPAQQQLKMKKEPLMIVVGHANATLRESLLRKVFPLAEKFVSFTQKEFKYGMIGPFCLQTVVDEDLNFYVYDIATRIGGGTNIHMYQGHAYSNILFRSRMSSGRRLALEIKRGIELERLDEIVC